MKRFKTCVLKICSLGPIRYFRFFNDLSMEARSAQNTKGTVPGMKFEEDNFSLLTFEQTDGKLCGNICRALGKSTQYLEYLDVLFGSNETKYHTVLSPYQII